MGWADRDLIAQVVLVFAIWISGVLAAWLGTRYLVTRWTQRLFETTSALSKGDLSARADLEGAPLEIKQLGDTLAEMASRLNTRQGELKAAIEQKEGMLREIHHRIKNNLQTVTSLLNLYSRGVKNKPAMHALLDVRIRVQALALVHRHLYEGPENRSVNAKALIGELCQLIQLSSGVARTRVAIVGDVAPIDIGIDRAVPLALLATEVVTNALKHGFPEGRAGTVRVTLAVVDNADVKLTISMTGSTIPSWPRPAARPVSRSSRTWARPSPAVSPPSWARGRSAGAFRHDRVVRLSPVARGGRNGIGGGNRRGAMTARVGKKIVVAPDRNTGMPCPYARGKTPREASRGTRR